MADRHSTPKQQTTFAANAALFVIVAMFAAPALATTKSLVPCSDATAVDLEIPAQVLITEVVNHDIPVSSIKTDTSIDDIESVSSTSFLVPRAEAAIRNAFEQSDSASSNSSVLNQTNALLTPPMAGTDTKTESTDDEKQQVPESGMNTKLHGVSDDDSSRFKKQMYRRDI
jgi:hypothetical protein